MITVPFQLGEALGRVQLSFNNPNIAMENYFIPYQGSSQKKIKEGVVLTSFF